MGRPGALTDSSGLLFRRPTDRQLYRACLCPLDDIGSSADLRSGKHSQIQVGNAWIIEIAELASVKTADNAAVKAFISRKVDIFRKPYGRNLVNQPRQCVLAATTNETGGHFADPTGNVRFWPLRCTSINIDTLRADRDQFWAEAAHRYHAGEARYLVEEDARQAAAAEQEHRVLEDVWQNLVDTHLDTVKPRVSSGGVRRCWVNLAEVMHVGIGIENARLTNVSDQKHAVRCLRRAGWVKYREKEGAREYRYCPTDEVPR